VDFDLHLKCLDPNNRCRINLRRHKKTRYGFVLAMLARNVFFDCEKLSADLSKGNGFIAIPTGEQAIDPLFDEDCHFS
jgi:hypothetical protein